MRTLRLRGPDRKVSTQVVKAKRRLTEGIFRLTKEITRGNGYAKFVTARELPVVDMPVSSLSLAQV